MSFQFYLHKSILYMPVIQQAKSGFYIGVGPIAAINVVATTDLRKAIGETLARPVIVVPDPDPRKPVNNMLEMMKLKSWAALERESTLWRVREAYGRWNIAIQQSRKDGGGDDPARGIFFPPGTPVNEVADRMVGVVQEKARELGQL